MGLLAILVIGLAGWLIVTGRLQRMTARDGMMLGVAIVGALMAAKGKPMTGAIPLLASAAYFAWRRQRDAGAKSKSTSESTAGFDDNMANAEARALLGLPADADADAVRAAHRRLIANVHPDKGGTPALAARINAARDQLLREAAARAGQNR